MILICTLSILLLIIAYLLGSIPNAVWIGKKYYGIDVREHGSKNAGSTNVLRVLGRRAALPVFALDILKGFVAVTLVKTLGHIPEVSNVWLINLGIAAVFAAILGHIFPIFAGFNGGKGVATLVGAVLGINPPVVLLCLGVWLIIFMIFHYVSLASMIAGVCFPVFTIISSNASESTAFIIFTIIIALLLIWTHRKNIERLREGTESKIYLLKKREPNE
ncbi:MAG: glycerol-3-phosphate 1-O-acyltransferase PlsY [Rikenellaceae bacterium]